jgi:hypothetical protein
VSIKALSSLQAVSIKTNLMALAAGFLSGVGYTPNFFTFIHMGFFIGIKESTRIGPAAMGFFFVGHWDGGLVT